MPKISLMNKETGKLQDFEPVDAREVLRMEESIYEVPEDKEEEAGGHPQDVNIPQLQGDDAELQVGLSIDKYGRSNVVKASPGNPEFSPPPRQAMTTDGKVLPEKEVDAKTLEAQEKAKAEAEQRRAEQQRAAERQRAQQEASKGGRK